MVPTTAAPAINSHTLVLVGNTGANELVENKPTVIQPIEVPILSIEAPVSRLIFCVTLESTVM